MSVRRQADGSYLLRWLDGGKAGRYRSRVLRDVTDAEAKKEHKKLVGASAVRPSRRGSATVSDVCERYLLIRGPQMAARWRPQAEAILRNRFIPRFGTVRAEDLHRSVLSKYANERRLEVTEPTVSREVGTFVAAFNLAEQEGLLDRSPFPRGGLRLSTGARRDVVLTPEEWGKLRYAFDDLGAWHAHRAKVRRLGPLVVDNSKEEGARERRRGGGPIPDSKAGDVYRRWLRASMDVFEALLLTGSRLMEIVELRWSAVDLRAGILRVRQEKTGREKVLPIVDGLREVLERQPRGVGEALVFESPDRPAVGKGSTRRGGPWGRKPLWGAFKLAKKLSGVRGDARIHDLRHTAASWLAEEGYSDTVIAEVLGHARPGATNRYITIRVEHLREPLEALARRAATCGKASPGDVKVTFDRPKRAQKERGPVVVSD